MVSLVDLPTEILVHICSSLCLHCELPRVVDAPSAAVGAASSGQKVHSQLSQCSKKLRAASHCPNSLVSLAAYDADRLCKRAAERIGGHLLKLCLDTPNLGYFSELAIAITPQLSQLCLQRKLEWSRIDEWCWTGWPYDLPALRCLVFESARENPDDVATYHIYHTVTTQRRRHGTSGHDPPRVPLARGLEDTQLMALNPERHLGHVKPILRPTATTTLADAADIQSIIDYSNWLGGITSMDTIGLSFASFPILEVLELEQLLLYGPVFPTAKEPAEDRSSMLTTPDEFLSKFPRHSARFPQLKVVRLDVFKAPPQEQVRLLVEAFRAAADIKVLIYHVARTIGSRGLLPASPGHEQPVPEALLYLPDPSY
ncbi:uncharacterized protein BP5553_08757 [Venustampulla echinocandica]|uniref:Uncharacterized protein n=1 Tax=Venustampulla echinocandica TaxID=2656787 RepID=A0A370TF49_9HELO|nr:uncharacterized protein BP5553_08757 [Venustampulla echinocandica]RDL33318.1 hypothetical protein BP5553_08757 [Venustampulla echinocandica]